MNIISSCNEDDDYDNIDDADFVNIYEVVENYFFFNYYGYIDDDDDDDDYDDDDDDVDDDDDEIINCNEKNHKTMEDVFT